MTRGTRPRSRSHNGRVGAVVIGSVAVLALALSACSSTPSPSASPTERVSGGPTGHYIVPTGIHKIKHVIVIEQENRSFDSYFGTFPGADGIPMKNGVPTVCVPVPTGGCQKPYHDTADVNGGGPHNEPSARARRQRREDGRVHHAGEQSEEGLCVNTSTIPRARTRPRPDVMGYHTAAEIPNYWTYAKDFVLDDHMFEPVKSWSLPDHLYLVSGWSAKCSSPVPVELRQRDPGPVHAGPDAAGTSIRPSTPAPPTSPTPGRTSPGSSTTSTSPGPTTCRPGTSPTARTTRAVTCPPVAQSYLTPGIWNPLPIFEDVQKDHQLRNIQPLNNYFAEAKAGTLPVGDVGHPVAGRQRAPAGQRPPGPGLRHRRHQRGHEEPRLGLDRHLLAVGRLGRLLRQRRAAPGRPERLRAAGPGDGDLALRQDGVHRPPDAARATPTSSSSRTTSWAGPGSTPRPTVDPIPGPTSGRTRASWATWTSDFDFNQAPRPPVLLPTNPPTDSPTIPAYFNGLGPCVGCTATPPST